MEKALYPYGEAAELLSVSVDTVRRWVQQGKLRTVGEGCGRKITAGSIRRLGELDAGAPESNAHSAPGVRFREKTACHIEGKGRPTTGHRSSHQMERELDDLLAPQN